MKQVTARFFYVFVLLLGAALSAHAQSTVYTANVTGPYTSKTDFTAPCGLGPCQNFTFAMTPTGSFTTSSPLGANLGNASIKASITSFTFNDGINTYSSSDSAVRLHSAQVSTNAGGTITATNFIVERWLSGTSPHAVNDLFSYTLVNNTTFQGHQNSLCGSIGASSGTADTCLSEVGAHTSRSIALGAPYTWSSAAAPVASAPAAIPTLSEWGIILTTAFLGLAGFAILRRRPM